MPEIPENYSLEDLPKEEPANHFHCVAAAPSDLGIKCKTQCDDCRRLQEPAKGLSEQNLIDLAAKYTENQHYATKIAKAIYKAHKAEVDELKSVLSKLGDNLIWTDNELKKSKEQLERLQNDKKIEEGKEPTI